MPALATAKSVLFRWAERFGYTVIPNWRINQYPLAQHLKKVFDACEIDCVLDVGANKGQYGQFLRDTVGYTGPIISFEPVTKNFAELKRKSEADPAWECCQLAVGSAAATLNINVMHDDQFSSFLKPHQNKLLSDHNYIVGTEQTPVCRLDQWIDDRKLPYKRIYLKLDTQGFDLEAFRGVERRLERIVAMQSEVSFMPIYEGMPTATQMIEAATHAGFNVSNMFVVTLLNAQAVEFDCIFVRASTHD